MSMYDLVKKIDALMENVEPAAAKTPTRIQEILVILEERMSPAQKEKREEIVKGMKKDVAGLKKRYGDRWEDVMYATATKQAVSEAADATDYRPKSQGGTRKELLAKYKKSGDPKDAAAARRAGATQAELKAAKKTVEEGIKQIVRKFDPTIKSRLRRKADKLDDLGDETGQDLKYMDMEPQDVMTRAMDPETHYRNADRYRRLANKKQGVEEGSNAAKPDFLDLDKDGNKKESMKKAQQDLASKKKVDESVSVNISASDADAFGVIMKLAGLPVIGASQDSVAPETTSMGACMEARDDETPYDNKPDEKYSSIRDVTRAGKDLNRPKSQHADKAKLGDNPLATDLTESLWQAYEDLKKKI